MSNKHMKRRSMSPIIREIQIKTIIIYHFALIRMAIIKNKGRSRREGRGGEGRGGES